MCIFVWDFLMKALIFGQLYQRLTVELVMRVLYLLFRSKPGRKAKDYFSFHPVTALLVWFQALAYMVPSMQMQMALTLDSENLKTIIVPYLFVGLSEMFSVLVRHTHATFSSLKSAVMVVLPVYLMALNSRRLFPIALVNFWVMPSKPVFNRYKKSY